MKPLPLRPLVPQKPAAKRAAYDHIYSDAADLAVGQERPWEFSDVVSAQKAQVAVTKFLKANGGKKRWTVTREGNEVSVGRTR